MTNQIKEQQVIEYLKGMRNSLLEEIKSIDKTIEGIKANRGSSDATLSNLSYGLTAEDEKRFAKKKLASVEKFHPQSKLDQKISYALTNVGQGFKEDILDVLHREQPDLDIHKLEKVLAVRLSYLLKSGLIAGKKIGRRYEYSLIEE
ncbi:hypothetical protein GCM10023231_25270 [Olivibacter ginsenosidimutans]|uniref:Soluble adenylyl cyclase-like protein n=1 Tax=Olivibacter ginsenosidimutans TaxID=1176537 RepID=A0ABP9BII0_9SPHI